ncbi:UvrD-helicase domain-containing protein [Microbacterium maritypicum]
MNIAIADWTPRGVEKLEKAAWAALKAGTASVAAGPGAGKSEFLAQRASYLLETGLCAHPQQILAISFKRSAASNLRNRVRDRVPDHASRVSSMTFDAFTKMLVDRFGNLLPKRWALPGSYRIGYASTRDVDAFITDVAASAPPELREGIYGIRSGEFISKLLGATPLGDEQPDAPTAEEYAVDAWWAYRYRGKSLPIVDFVMLNRLAELIVRSSPQLRRALAATYPYVFVDEFQDTTFAQYSFLRELFAGSSSEVTAVGDRNQRIMGWAGALSDAFKEFEVDFEAESFALTSNYRSSKELVDLQHHFAKILSPDAAKQASQVLSTTGDAPAQVWSFKSERAEAMKIAEWVRNDMEMHGHSASDYAILARQRVADIEPRMRRAFRAQDLGVRNDDALIGDYRLQEILGDDLTRLFIDTVRLASSRGGQPDAWLRTADALKSLLPPGMAHDGGDSWEELLSDYLSNLRAWFTETSALVPASTTAGANELAAGLLERFTDFLSLDVLGNGRHLAENPDEAEDSSHVHRPPPSRYPQTVGVVGERGRHVYGRRRRAVDDDPQEQGPRVSHRVHRRSRR